MLKRRSFSVSNGIRDRDPRVPSFLTARPLTSTCIANRRLRRAGRSLEIRHLRFDRAGVSALAMLDAKVFPLAHTDQDPLYCRGVGWLSITGTAVNAVRARVIRGNMVNNHGKIRSCRKAAASRWGRVRERLRLETRMCSGAAAGVWVPQIPVDHGGEFEVVAAQDSGAYKQRTGQFEDFEDRGQQIAGTLRILVGRALRASRSVS